MIVTVDFMKTTDDPRVIEKHVNNIKTVTCKPFEDCGVSDIRLIAEYDPDLLECNMVYINDFRRFYQVQVTTGPGSRLYVVGHVDVLTSFSDKILNLSVNVTRSADQVEQFLPDNDIGVTASAETTVIAADDPQNNKFIWGLGDSVSYALGVIGKSSATPT